MTTQYLILLDSDIDKQLSQEQQVMMLGPNTSKAANGKIWNVPHPDRTVKDVILFLHPDTIKYKLKVNDILYQVVPFGRRIKAPNKFVLVDGKITEDIAPEFKQFYAYLDSLLGDTFSIMELAEFKEFMKLNT
ncbi:MAG: hypothetical protein KAH32_02950, partial [Chlamydiia bacterium]|nr:hypothetical protein [Chlamydiia bacterium]